MNSISIRIHNQTTGKTVPAEVHKNVTATELLRAFFVRIGLPADTEGSLTLTRGNQRLSPSETLGSADIVEGDILEASIEFRGAGGIPVKAFSDIQLIDAFLRYGSQTDWNPFTLFAIILYTDADKNIAEFVHDNFRELHRLAGRNFAFYVIERPDRELLGEIRKDLESKLNENDSLALLLKKIDADRFLILDRTNAYQIGEHFGVKPTQFPCLIFFSDLESREVLILELESLLGQSVGSATTQDIIQAFRKIFQAATIASSRENRSPLARLKAELSVSRKSEDARERAFVTIAEALLKESVGAAIKVVTHSLTS